jgi:drug/metabolite transporter (DMT)-like permease
MIVAGALFAAMGAFVKLGAHTFSSAELVFYRSAFGLAAMLAVARVHRLPLATSHFTLHATRSLAGLVSLGLYFHCIASLPLATAVTLNYTSPLFLALLASWYARQRPGRALLAALALGFAGVWLVLRPTFPASQSKAGMLGLVSGLLAAIAYLSVKQLGDRGEPEWRVVFYFVLVSTVASGAWVLTGPIHRITPGGGWILLGLGTTALVAQLAMTRAYQSGHPLVAGSLSYTTVAFSAVIGLGLWDEALSASAWIGIALIVGSGLLAMRGPARPGPA